MSCISLSYSSRGDHGSSTANCQRTCSQRLVAAFGIIAIKTPITGAEAHVIDTTAALARIRMSSGLRRSWPCQSHLGVNYCEQRIWKHTQCVQEAVVGSCSFVQEPSSVLVLNQIMHQADKVMSLVHYLIGR